MTEHPYYAVVYAYKDGEETAYMPCLDEEQVFRRAAKYDRVKVVKNGQPPFWLRVNQGFKNSIAEEERKLAEKADIPELLRAAKFPGDDDLPRKPYEGPKVRSDIFYSGIAPSKKGSFW